MARLIERIKSAQFDALEAGIHADGNELFVQVTPAGSKSAFLRYKHDGRLRKIGLGSCPSYGDLKVLREKAGELRRQASEGTDLQAERDRAREAERDRARAEAKPEPAPVVAKESTFRACAEHFLGLNAEAWRNAKHRQQWTNTLSTYVYPRLGDMNVADITPDEIVEVLQPIWLTKVETAKRVRGRIEAVLANATARKLRSGANPATLKANLDQLLPRWGQQHKPGHHVALPFTRLPDFMVELHAMPALAARALEFATLTGARTGEVLFATWDEFDLKKSVWSVPADRMKSGRAHRVPLTPRATAALEAARPFAIDGNPFVFPGEADGKPLSNMAMLNLLDRMGEAEITVHGFRSAFRDWAAEMTDHRPDVVEMALAHAIGNKVEAAYRRGDLFEKRKALMADWAAYCGSSKEQPPVVGKTVADVLHVRIASRVKRENALRAAQYDLDQTIEMLDAPFLRDDVEFHARMGYPAEVGKRKRGRPRKVRV